VTKTTKELISAVGRELGMRKRAYPRWVETGRMTQIEADHQLECMDTLYAMLKSREAKELDAEKYGYKPGCPHCAMVRAFRVACRAENIDADGLPIKAIATVLGRVLRTFAGAKKDPCSPEGVVEAFVAESGIGMAVIEYVEDPSRAVH
jgi:hypothetical protein